MSTGSDNRKFGTRESLVLTLIILWLILVLYNYVYYHDEHLIQLRAVQNLAIDVVLFLIVAVVALGVGGQLLSLARLRIDRLGEGILFASALGFGVISYAMMILGMIGLLYWWAACGLLVVLFLIAVPKIKDYLNPLFTKSRSEIKALWSQPITAFIFIIILFQLLMNVSDCLTPPYEWDTLSYHLGCQSLYVKAHRFIHLPFIHQSYYTCGVEMIYGLGLLLNSDIFAKVLHCYFGFLTLLAIYLFAGRYFTRKLGLVAALIFYTCPVIVWFSGVGKTDLAADFYCFLAVFALLRWRLEREGPHRLRWLALSAILLGLSIHVSYRGFVLLAAVLFYLAFVLLFDRKEPLRAKLAAVGIIVLISCAIPSPWLIRNAVLTDGNPVYPYLPSVFNSPTAQYFDTLIIKLRQQEPTPPAPVNVSRLPMLKQRLYFLSLPFWDFTILGRNYDFVRFNAKITPLYLCLVPLLFLCRRTRLIRILLALALSYILLQQLMRIEHLRYLSPVYALLAILAGYVAVEGFAHFRLGKSIHRFLLTVVIVVTLSLVWINFLFFYRGGSLYYVSRIESRDAFLERKSSSYYCLAYANSYLPPDSKLLLLADERIYYSYYPAIPITARRFVNLMRGYQFDVERLHQLLRSLGITHLLYNPFFHRIFEQDKEISDTLENALEEYKKAHLSLVTERYGIELYELKD